MNELSEQAAVQTMSSVEIAKLTGKQHKDVLRDIRKILAEVDIDSAQFCAVYKDQKLIDRPCFNLPRRECDLVIAGYSAKYRLAIIDRWQELESMQQPKLPMTYVEALQCLVQSEIDKQRALDEVAKLTAIIDNEFGYSSILRAATYAGVHEKTFNWRVLKTCTLGLGLTPRKVPSPRYGYQLLYPIKAFQVSYPDIDFDDLTPELVDDKAALAIAS